MRTMMPQIEEVYETVKNNGLQVEFTIKSAEVVFGPSEVRESGFAAVKFRISDETTGKPLSVLKPLAWLDKVHDSGQDTASPEPVCQEAVKTYMQGLVGRRPMVDLNSFFILSMNNDATISVIDPMVNVGGMTQLYTMVLLDEPGEDWAMTVDSGLLFVSQPLANQVAVVDTESFQVVKKIFAGNNPTRLALGPDEETLWVSNDYQNRDESGVTVIDLKSLEVAAHIPTGAGSHTMAFSPDGNYVFVTNSESGRLSVIDARNYRKIKDLRIGNSPGSVVVSQDGRLVYVTDQASGAVSVIDAEDLEVVGRIPTSAGSSTLGLAPDGNWLLAVNPVSSQVFIIDLHRQEVVYQLPIPGNPDQVTFSSTSAYFRSTTESRVTVLKLADLEQGGELELVSFPIGTRPPSSSPHQTAAGAVFMAPDNESVLVANAAEGRIFYYHEPSQAQMGTFQAYDRSPRAVRVVDRSLREEAPGIYSGRVKIPQSGSYQVAFFLDQPRMVHCFQFTAKPRAEEEAQVSKPVEVIFTEQDSIITVNQDNEIQFLLRDPETGNKIDREVIVSVTSASGVWTQRLSVNHKEGEYSVSFKVPEPGIYYLYFRLPEYNLGPNKLPRLLLQAVSD
jgi:YVTN family beta-propeller protein